MAKVKKYEHVLVEMYEYALGQQSMEEYVDDILQPKQAITSIRLCMFFFANRYTWYDEGYDYYIGSFRLLVEKGYLSRVPANGREYDYRITETGISKAREIKRLLPDEAAK